MEISFSIFSDMAVEEIKKRWAARIRGETVEVFLSMGRTPTTTDPEPFYRAGVIGQVIGLDLSEGAGGIISCEVAIVCTHRARLTEIYSALPYIGWVEAARNNPPVYDDDKEMQSYMSAIREMVPSYKRLMELETVDEVRQFMEQTYTELISPVAAADPEKKFRSIERALLCILHVIATEESWQMQFVDLHDVLQEIVGLDSPLGRIRKINQILSIEIELRQVKAFSRQDTERGGALETAELDLDAFFKKAHDNSKEKLVIRNPAISTARVDRYKDQMTELDTERQSEFVRDARAFLNSYVVGQDRAIGEISSALEDVLSGLQDPKKPKSSMIFLGPSGVGKTSLVRALAKLLFRNDAAMTRVDLSEYSESHTVSRLIGSPPGYVGFDDGEDNGTTPSAFPIWSNWNIYKHHFFYENDSPKMRKARKEIERCEKQIASLIKEARRSGPQAAVELLMPRYKAALGEIEKIKREAGWVEFDPDRKYVGIVLLDELGREHQSVTNLLLQILDNGAITQANGQPTDFSRVFLFATSNIGSSRIQDALAGRGGPVGLHHNNPTTGDIDERIYKDTMDEAEKKWPPEFRGRWNQIIVFRPLPFHDVLTAFDLHLQLYMEALESRGLSITIKTTEDARELIAKEATDKPELGIRLLESKMRKYIMRKISRLRNTKQIRSGDTIVVCLKRVEGEEKPRAVLLKDSKGFLVEIDTV